MRTFSFVKGHRNLPFMAKIEHNAVIFNDHYFHPDICPNGHEGLAMLLDELQKYVTVSWKLLPTIHQMMNSQKKELEVPKFDDVLDRVFDGIRRTIPFRNKQTRQCFRRKILILPTLFLYMHSLRVSNVQFVMPSPSSAVFGRYQRLDPPSFGRNPEAHHSP